MEKKLEAATNARCGVEEELCRAYAQHPQWPTDLFEAYAIVAEECGEVAQAILDWKHRGAPKENIGKEMIQVAAMAIRFLENMEV